MALQLPSISFILVLLLLLYLSTFIFFSILRVITGISIQRIGLSSLRRIAYTPRDGVKLEVRGLGLQVHRPTFAQPTWLSLVVTELCVTLDLNALNTSQAKDSGFGNGLLDNDDDDRSANGSPSNADNNDDESKPRERGEKKKNEKAGIFAKLTQLKEKVKRLHRIIHWIKLVDIVANKSSFVILGVGTIQVGTFHVSVDTRKTTVDRSRIFQHKRKSSESHRPAEWTVATRSVLFTPEGKDSVEILDLCILNVHGFLYPNVEGLREASISLKLGRIHIPYDDFIHTSTLARQEVFPATDSSGGLDGSIEGSEDSLLHEEHIRQTISDAKGFVKSILRGIHEVSLAVSFVGLSKRIDSVQPSGSPIHMNMSLKELGMDLYRLDPTTPAHSMYFSRQDIAHQALLSALSIAVGLDDGLEHPERLLYVPMTTATVKTTLPAKILQFSRDTNTKERNTNVLFANIVVTSPSIDVDPKHLPVVLAILENRPTSTSDIKKTGHHFMSQLLPKAKIKLSIHEPVVRVSLPTVEKNRTEDDFDFDLIVSAISSISVELDSFHSAEANVEYLLSTILRVVSHRLYYQTASRQQHDLHMAELTEIKSQITAAPQLVVIASATFQTFSMFMVRPEINDGVRQIVRQLRMDVKSDKLRKPKSPHDGNVLRSLPSWLHTLSLQALDFNFEIAGIDSKLSTQPRGLALHLDSLTTEYKAFKDDDTTKRNATRRRGSISMKSSEIPVAISPPPKQRKGANPTDGRRLAIHIKTFEAFVIQLAHSWEEEPFLSLPRAEVALTTGNDGHGPVLHVNSHTRSLMVQYSLFRHYCLGVATMMLRKTFARPERTPVSKSANDPASHDQQPNEYHSSTTSEFVVVDVRADFLQIKAQLPSDPATMLHVVSLQAARHRHATPYVRSQLLRMYAAAPHIKNAWSRIVSAKGPRIDIREGVRRHGTKSVTERSIDFVAEALRFGIPHQLIVHRIFDNLINTAKTAAQLHHRFLTGSDEYILSKHPEGPKHVPRITVRVHMFLFELEDSAFEFKLGCIYRAGLVEQKQRLAREEAFRLKAHRVQQQSQQATSKIRSSSTQRNKAARSRSRGVEGSRRSESYQRRRSMSPSIRGRRMRYDREGTCGLSGSAKTTINDAWDKLQRYNAQSWKKRIDRSMNYDSGSMQSIRSLFGGLDEIPMEHANNERILQIPMRPALLSILISDLNITIDKPSFAPSELPDFMYTVGKGLPKDTKFSLLIPLNAHFEMGEARVTLREYPLPLLHIPAIKPGQSPKLPSWSIKTDFVIAEEFRGSESTRDLKIMVVPADKIEPGSDKGGFAVDVRRTVSPVKTYSDITVDINTARDTRFTWGTSYQPAIQDMMQVIEGFSKPMIDPSDRVGFWDKIRLSFHSRITVAWKGGGDVHLTLKGSRDPYVVTGYGAGFVMVWRNNVCWNIWRENEPTKFMTVDSGDFVLAIPDFSPYARDATEVGQGKTASLSSNRYNATFKKVIMKLSGKVRWLGGLVFERTLPNGGRSFDFKHHYDVTLKNPIHVKSIQGQDSYDAFAGFRSHHIHMSIAISAPSDRDWALSDLRPSSNYNSVHLSPRFFTHFFAWWAMFSGVMSLPVRQGALFPMVEKSGKKFGRHLATIKYSLLMSPLYISHVYKHKEAEEFSDDTVAATGLKARLDSFMLDLHQRREEFDSTVKELNKTVKTTGMKINQALLDLVSADIRAVSASMTGTSVQAVRNATSEKLATFHDTPQFLDLSKFTIPDNDFGWIDVDDFVEVDWSLPTDADPETKILPLMFAPRFTYRRQTDHNLTNQGDTHRHSHFGYEPTHACIMSSQNDSRQVQMSLITDRLDRIEESLDDHTRAIGEQELKVVREVNNQAEHQKKLDEMREHKEVMHQKQSFLRRMLQDLQRRLERHDLRAVPQPEELDMSESELRDVEDPEPEEGFENSSDIDQSTHADHVSDFSNRFVVHNAQIKWNNPLRDILLRYMHQVSQRRGFVYYTSQRAVKFILDIIEEQKKSKQSPADPEGVQDANSQPNSPFADDEVTVQDRIAQLLADGQAFVDANDSEETHGRNGTETAEDAHNVSNDFIAQNTYHVRLVAPQIQLQSEKNLKSAVLITARGMRLKVFQIMDKERMFDQVSGLVQRRFMIEMDNMQFFVTSKATFNSNYLQMYSGNHYGGPPGVHWPPWVPIEAMFDFNVHSYGFHRVVQRTSASMRFDKYNKLRLKYNDTVTGKTPSDPENTENGDTQIDQLWVEFPHLRAICDSSQYYAMYIIVLDLLLYNEPLEKTRSERLEKIMLASDFSDLRGAPEIVTMLQDRIRQLDEIKSHFHINEKDLDRKGWEDRIALEQDLSNCEEELFFIMKAITTSQRRNDDKLDNSQDNGLLKWYISSTEIVWHLIKDIDEPLAEFQLGRAAFERTDNSDGSNYNSIHLDRIQGLNLLPNAVYPEIITAYTEHLKGAQVDQSEVKMLRVNWLMLEAIAGIPVVDHFEVNMFPVKVQLEYETGKQLFEYVFPGAGAGEDGGFSPFMLRQQVNQDEEDEDAAEAETERRKSIAKASADQTGGGTGAGSLEHRLQPTMKLSDQDRPQSSASNKKNGLGINMGMQDSSISRFLHDHRGSRTSLSMGNKKLNPKPSNESMRSRKAKDKTGDSTFSASESEKHRMFRRQKNRQSGGSESTKGSKKGQSDDLTQMLNRASNYMTLAYVRIPSVVLCLSYKGKGSRNFEDVHHLVFRMPTLEYRNKTWSNLDLALALKKDVIRALISHTGAIIGNKFTHHKPGRSAQNRLRELASSSVILSSSANVSRVPSETSSLANRSSPRISDVTDDYHQPTQSYASSLSAVATDAAMDDIEAYEDIAPDDTKEANGNDHPVRQTLSRHFSELTQRARKKEPSPSEEPDDSSPQKLGGLKKIFQSVSHHRRDD